MRHTCLGALFLGLFAVLMALATWGCIVPPPTPLPPGPGPAIVGTLTVHVCEGPCSADHKVPGARVKLRDGTEPPVVLIADGAGNAHATLLPGAWRVEVAAEGFRPWATTIALPAAKDMVLEASLERSVRQRRGVVRLEGWSLVDDDGPFLATGATLFWGLWGYQHDRTRLEANLRWLAETQAVDYIRVLGTVGGQGWEDRSVDCRAPGWEADVAGLTDLAYDTFGLRLEWTLFGGLNHTPTRADQEAAVDGLLRAVRGREHKVVLLETANEGWQTGFGGEAGLAELRALTRRLNAGTDILVAATSNHEGLFCETYAGGIADLATIHFDRETRLADGPWRPVRQPWGYPGELNCTFTLPPGSSNEPIGPYSSVAEERDPTRLIAQVLVAHLAGLPTSVMHAGPGIYGGGWASGKSGSPANLWETDRLADTLQGLAAIKALLPGDLASWDRHNSGWATAPFAVDELWPDANADHGAVRVYSARRGEQFVTLAFGIRQYVTLTARWPMSVDLIRVPDGEVIGRRDLNAGETWRLEEGDGAWLLRSSK